MIQRLREPVNALTHLFGAFLSAGGLALLLYWSAQRGTGYDVFACALFGASLILLYTASGLYHALRVSARGLLWLRRLDHMAIYLLIAGTYAPFCLGPLRGPWGWSLFAAIWGLALLGILVKLFWIDAPRWLNVSFYVLMGWLVVVAFYPLAQSVPSASLRWLVAGGLIYTMGAVVYGAKWPRLPALAKRGFGFHELWHLFVLGGSISHFLAVYYLLK